MTITFRLVTKKDIYIEQLDVLSINGLLFPTIIAYPKRDSRKMIDFSSYIHIFAKISQGTANQTRRKPHELTTAVSSKENLSKNPRSIQCER